MMNFSVDSLSPASVPTLPTLPTSAADAEWPRVAAALTACSFIIVVGVILNAVVIVVFLAERLLQGASTNVHVFSQRCVVVHVVWRCA